MESTAFNWDSLGLTAWNTLRSIEIHWDTQRHSYADRLYNGQYNMSGPAYSPCFKFFTPAEAELPSTSQSL